MRRDDRSDRVPRVRTARANYHVLVLRGTLAPTPWDPSLAEVMKEANRAVMEERLIATLLEDLRRRSTNTT